MRLLTLLMAAALIFAALVLPNHPGTMKLSALHRFPLELPVLLFGMMALGRVRWVPTILALLLTATVILKAADYGTFTAYNRTFNPILDLFLVQAGANLLADSIGWPLAAFSIALGMVAIVLTFLGLQWALHTWSRVDLLRPLRLGAASVAVIAASVTITDAGHALDYWSLDKSPPGTSWTTRLTFKRVLAMQDTARDLADFRAQTLDDPLADRGGLFDQLGARDVLIVFLESYGRTSFTNPLYRPTHIPTLQQAERVLRTQGVALRSGWLTSPTSGGQSWLAHGALASGLWTSDQARYNAMLASGRKGLFHLAQEAGYRTGAVMPAITVAWPESALMGFDHVLEAADLGYKGERFNWVTMPDQYTLAAYPQRLPHDTRPDFLQIALISSHAPWVPIPPVIDWDAVGDGMIFTQWATQGPTPKEVWRDRDRVREQYRKAIDYTLRVTFDFAARQTEAPLIIVVGDHQPAGFVSQSESMDVPIHVLGPPDIIALLDSWNWTDGLIPDDALPALPMDEFRNKFIDAVSSSMILAEGR